MKYICEICGKSYTEIEHANECELNCKEEKARKEKLKNEKEQRLNIINEMLASYNKDYGTNYYVVKNIFNYAPLDALFYSSM